MAPVTEVTTSKVTIGLQKQCLNANKVEATNKVNTTVATRKLSHYNHNNHPWNWRAKNVNAINCYEQPQPSKTYPYNKPGQVVNHAQQCQLITHPHAAYDSESDTDTACHAMQLSYDSQTQM